MVKGPSKETLNVLAQAPNMYLVLSPELIILTASNVYLEAIKSSRTDIVGKHIFDAFPNNPDLPNADGVQNIYASLLEVLRTRKPHHMDIQRYDVPNNERPGEFIHRYWDPTHTPILDENGEIQFIIQLALNITDRLNTERQLKQAQDDLLILNNSLKDQVKIRTNDLALSEEKYRSLIENSPVAMQVLRGPDFVFELVNREMLSFLGKTDEIIGKTLYEGVPEILGQPIVVMLQHVFATGEPSELKAQEVTLVRNGERHTGFYDVIYRALSDNGEISGVLGIAIDVTEQIFAQHAIQESEERFRSLVLQAPVAMNVFSTRNLIIDLANERMLKIWGKGNAVLGQPLADAMPELSGQPIMDTLLKVFDTGEIFYGNESKAILERNGKFDEHYFNLIYKPIRDKANNITAILQVANEVTEQVNAREGLVKSEERMRMAIEAAKLATFEINPIDRSLIPSPRLKEFFGYNVDDDVSFDAALERIHPDYRQHITDMVDLTLTTGVKYDVEYPIIGFRDQRTRWVRGVGAVQNGNDRTQYFVGVLHEITEQKQDEQRKNDFITMVSHELKTPLTSLKAYSQLLERYAKDKQDTFTVGLLNKCLSQIEKMNVMIHGFLNVSRLESGKILMNHEEFDMALLISEAKDESISMYTSREFIFEPVVKTIVLADRNKIGQVIGNFISNAVKYSPTKSTIRVACINSGEFVQVSVTDEGVGVPISEREKLFERFYRSASVSSSTISGFGIGLYLSAEIIQHHEGKIWIESEMGKGSTFYFTIPR